MEMPELPNKIVYVGKNWVIRLRQSLVSASLVAALLLDHEDLWQWNFKSIFKLVLIILLAFNGNPVGKDRK